MVLNKFICFISRAKTCISCTHYPFFALFRKHPARYATPLTAQDTSKSSITQEIQVDAPHKTV